MLSLEAIGVLGILYSFFMYGTLRATRAEKRERERRRVWQLPTRVTPETKPIK
jgi:hypothetical protein